MSCKTGLVYYAMENCTSSHQLRMIHAHMIRTHLIFNISAIRRFLAISIDRFRPSSSSLDYTSSIVFTQIHTPDPFIFNAMIRAYSRTSSPSTSFHFYNLLTFYSFPPHHLTFPFLLKSSSLLSRPSPGLQIHSHITKHGFSSDFYVQVSLINFYVSILDMNSAALILSAIRSPTVPVLTSMIKGFGKSMDSHSARMIFNHMREKNMVTWSTMMNIYLEKGEFDEVMELFYSIRMSDSPANEVVMVGVVSSCAASGILQKGERCHHYIIVNGIHVNLKLGTCLVDMYGRCGSLEKAIKIFRSLNEKDELCWAVLIAVLGIHGRAEQAVSYFNEMVGSGCTRPGGVAFTAVLTACSHGGLVDEGFAVFNSMKEVYGVEPGMEHYGCVVDLLGRSGRLQEAERFIKGMPVTPTAPVWGALLAACRVYGNEAMGDRVGKMVMGLNPDHCGYNILLSNIYAGCHGWEEVMDLRKIMKRNHVQKCPGYSIVDVNG